MIHTLPPSLLTGKVRVRVVGCGGTGSAVVSMLVSLHLAMLELGHPGGLHVTAMDGGGVTDANRVRQCFAPADVGLNKADVLINRINLFYGLRWQSVPQFLVDDDRCWINDEIVISCVDTRAARRTIWRALTRRGSVVYWLDLGNTDQTGQYLLGQPENHMNRREDLRLPTLPELYPEMVDPDLDDDTLPSCSAAESLERQGIYLNRLVATHAVNLLEQLFRFGSIAFHGEFLSPRNGIYSTLPVDPRHWALLGFTPTPAEAPLRAAA